MVNMTYALTKKSVQGGFDLVLNVGIAGSLNEEMQLGTVVAISEDRFQELGVEDGADFIPADKLDLIKSNEVVPMNPLIRHPFTLVKAISVNKVHGDDETILNLKSSCDAQIESMEGAAFYYVCNQEGLKCLQVRAVSNMVERRNRLAWDIPLALDALSDAIVTLLEGLPE